MDDIEKMAAAFRKVLSEGSGEGERAILIKRIPIICNDIIEIKTDIRWVKWLSMAVAGAISVSLVTKFI